VANTNVVAPAPSAVARIITLATVATVATLAIFAAFAIVATATTCTTAATIASIATYSSTSTAAAEAASAAIVARLLPSERRGMRPQPPYAHLRPDAHTDHKVPRMVALPSVREWVVHERG